MKNGLNFDKLMKENFKILHKHKLIYLATTCDDNVKTRIVDYHNEGLRIGFITWTNSIKIEDIKQNTNVTFCIENLQIKGKAELCGHPRLPKNMDFIESYKKRHPMPYKNFIELENVILVMVEPILTIMMVYEKNHLVLYHLDCVEKSTYKKMLSPWNMNL